MGMLLATNVDKQPMLPVIDGVIKNLFHDPADAFFTGRVMDILYDGVSVDCSADDKMTVAVCMNMRDQAAFRKIDDNHLSFSLFGGVSRTFSRFKCFAKHFYSIPLE